MISPREGIKLRNVGNPARHDVQQDHVIQAVFLPDMAMQITSPVSVNLAESIFAC